MVVGWVCALAVLPEGASARVEPESSGSANEIVTDAGLSADAGFMAQWVIKNGDNRGMPFAIVDKKSAHLYVYAPAGRLLGGSRVLLGLSVGDASITDIGARAPASLRPTERTTPAGRFASEPGHNAQGEDNVWFDYDASLAIHRLRPGPANEHRGDRMYSSSTSERRISFGCVVVPVAFYDAVVRPSLGRQRGIVYILPETHPVGDMIRDVQLSLGGA